jgi:histidine triad (HIT) family protein
MASYDDSNIFARILRGDIPSHTVYEDDRALAFMDVMPMVDGHCLVIPKAACRGLLDADATTLAHLVTVAQKVAGAAVKAMAADGFQLRQYNEAAGGQTVFHLHFHILPMKAGVALRTHTGGMADPALLAAQAAAIRAQLLASGE